MKENSTLYHSEEHMLKRIDKTQKGDEERLRDVKVSSVPAALLLIVSRRPSQPSLSGA